MRNIDLVDSKIPQVQGIVYLPHNRESDCLDRCVITKIDLGHYVHEKHMNFVPRALPRL